jgi:signal transduction histidine kinase
MSTSGGAPFTLTAGPERAITVLERGGQRIAVLVHDPTVTQNRELLQDVMAAAGLALENERLQAELRAQLIANAEAGEERRASRARIIEAGDQARRRLERNLHDGAQQRIVTLSVALSRAEQLLDHDRGEALELITAARNELGSALDELRELARGVHPAILNRSLRPALKSLVERSPVPVQLDGATPDELPIIVVATAYYVVAEALTNVARYSSASAAGVRVITPGEALFIEVHDDGVGGARLAPGSGLEGLRDRVDAIGGRFELDSPEGGGTQLSVRLPLRTDVSFG